jgi:hypothetical protein
VGRLTGQRLQAAGLGSLQALVAADPRRVELAAQRWADGGLAAAGLAAMPAEMPPLRTARTVLGCRRV